MCIKAPLFTLKALCIKAQESRIQAQFFTLKALCIKAQGREASRATLGNVTHNSNPHVVAAAPISGARRNVVRRGFFFSFPRVARRLAALGFDKFAFSVQGN